jgi:hypothetical protein
MGDSRTESDFRPVPVGRPPFRHRYEVFSPKLDRSVTLFSWDAVLAWTLIEATAQIDRFCERPGLIQVNEDWRLADFWVRRAGQSELWLLPDLNLPIIGAAPRIDSAPIITMPSTIAEQLKLHAVLIRNWQSALPYVTSNRRWITAQQNTRIITFCAQSKALVEIERRELPSDPVITRTVVFDLARRGLLHAEDMDSHPLRAGSRFIAA